MNSNAHFPQSGDQVLEKAIAARVALMLVTGMTQSAIAKEIGCGLSRIGSIMKSDECIAVMRQITNHEKDFAKARAAKRAGDLIDEAFRVIKDRLKKNDLKSAALVLKASGVFDEIESVNNDTHLMVIMPGASVPGAIDITPKKGDE